MWRLAVVALSGLQLWCSDGGPVSRVRGGNTTSTRLIVDRLGFLDVTELNLVNSTFLDFNGHTLTRIERDASSQTPLELYLAISRLNGSFNVGLIPDGFTANNFTVASIPAKRPSGKLKPLPHVSTSDAAFLDKMVAQKFVPYQNIPDSPGKSTSEIRTLGKRLFPFTPHNFEMAISLYDWTTASFARVVFMKIFEFTGIHTHPFPLDLPSIAEMIWESDFDTYTPSNPDYMNVFMMQPAASLVDVQSQLASGYQKLHEFSAVQNRLLAAAMESVPRTSIFAKPALFSGQVDVYQLGLDHFGIEFLECPLNKGPVTQELKINFASTLASYVAPGRVITTKMVWSFTEFLDDAMHYQNGILLVANPPRRGDSWVWDTAAYTTPLSDDPAKDEYTFKPGSRFEVQSIGQASVGGKAVVVIMLEPLPDSDADSDAGRSSRIGFAAPSMSLESVISRAEAYRPVLESQARFLNATAAATTPGARKIRRKDTGHTHYKLAHKVSGRRCACFDVLENRGI